MDYQLIMHLPCRCVQRVYSVFINLKVHTAQNLAVRANSVNTCLKYFFFLVLAGSFRESTLVAPNAIQSHRSDGILERGCKDKESA